MKSKGKYIGINQRIPFEILDEAIHLWILNGLVDKLFIYNRMLEYTTGLNRANKGANNILKVLNLNQSILTQLKKELKGVSYSSLRVEERKVICLCLTCLTFPITYDLLVALGQGFKVQNQINKKFISEKVMSIYGSNRTADIAIDALLPMIIEMNTIKRDKIGLYSLSNKVNASNKFVSELIVYTDIKLSGSKSILIDDLNHKPWYSYFEMSFTNLVGLNYLISKKDSAVGKGYLTMKS